MVRCLVSILYNLLDYILAFEMYLQFLNNLLDTGVRKDINLILIHSSWLDP